MSPFNENKLHAAEKVALLLIKIFQSVFSVILVFLWVLLSVGLKVGHLSHSMIQGFGSEAIVAPAFCKRLHPLCPICTPTRSRQWYEVAVPKDANYDKPDRPPETTRCPENMLNLCRHVRHKQPDLKKWFVEAPHGSASKASMNAVNMKTGGLLEKKVLCFCLSIKMHHMKSKFREAENGISEIMLLPVFDPYREKQIKQRALCHTWQSVLYSLGKKKSKNQYVRLHHKQSGCGWLPHVQPHVACVQGKNFEVWDHVSLRLNQNRFTHQNM